MSKTISNRCSEKAKYMGLLSQQFPTQQAAYTETINLSAIFNLPCPTEHFMSDIHGEYEAFTHILNNCSGVVRERVNALFAHELDERTRADLCTLIYYPDEKLDLMRERGDLLPEWYYEVLSYLIDLARTLSDCYTRSHVRKLLPEDYGYIIDELLHVSLGATSAHHVYHKRILISIVETGAGDDFIRSLSGLIKRLAVGRLHIVGDVFDRGPRADRVLDALVDYGSVDIQWGNHDVVWMGAAAGSALCVAQVVRTCVHYGTLDILEGSYGISLRRLSDFARATYVHEPGLTRMEKAIDAILFKLVEQAIDRHPEWGMSDRRLLGCINTSKGIACIGNRTWSLRTRDFPTLDPECLSRLTARESEVLDGLVESFGDSVRLRQHVGFLYEMGSVYLIRNGRLLFHGCVPMEADGSFSAVEIDGERVSGRGYLDRVDAIARRAWAVGDQDALDWMWYLWCGRRSPLAGRITKTFERAYITDEEAWTEPQDAYFELGRDEGTAKSILREFGLEGPRARIVNGHTPVHEKDGDAPVRAGGRLLVIDGGFCEAYHKATGIAGYTLISSADGLRIKAHRAFSGVREALTDNEDIASAHETVVEGDAASPLTVGDTDVGTQIRGQVEDLRELLRAYRSGSLKEGRTRVGSV